MKSEEVKSLIVKKVKEGKDYPEIHTEIERLKKSQIVFKQQKTELTKLRELVIRQEELIKDLKNKIFKLRVQVDSNEEIKREVLKENGDGDMRTLKRILLLIREENKSLCLTDIKQGCLYGDSKKLLSCLGFLEDVKVLKMEKDKNGVQRWLL
jgi:hypothetical protein